MDKENPIIPDQIITREDKDFADLTEHMRYTNGHEWMDETDEQPNWPPVRTLLPRLRQLIIKTLKSRKQYPHADEAFRILEKKNQNEP